MSGKVGNQHSDRPWEGGSGQALRHEVREYRDQPLYLSIPKWFSAWLKSSGLTLNPDELTIDNPIRSAEHTLKVDSEAVVRFRVEVAP